MHLLVTRGLLAVALATVLPVGGARANLGTPALPDSRAAADPLQAEVGSIAGTITHDLEEFNYGGSGLTIVAYDTSGRKVQGTTVVVPFYDASPIAYRLDGLPPGTYYVRAENPAVVGARPLVTSGGSLIEEVFPNIVCITVDCDVTRGAPIVVTGGAVTSGVDFDLASGGTIYRISAEARLYDARGVLVDPRRLRPPPVFLPFEAPVYVGLPPGNYYLRTLDGRLHRQLTCLDCPATAATPLVVRSKQWTEAVLPAPGSGTISGAVRRSGTLAPLTRIGVTAFDRTGAVVTTAVTNSAGAYVLGSLGNGAYYVRTSDDKGFVDRLFPDLPCERCDLAAGTPVVVTGAGATGIDFTLTPAAIVEGRVTDGEGAALADAAVEMIDGGGALHGRAITGPTGAYRLEVPPGTYRARSTPLDGHQLRIYDNLTCAEIGGCDAVGGTPIVASSSAPVLGVDLALPACSGVSLTPRVLALGAASTPYRQRFTAAGGTPPFRFRLVDGVLPAGVALDPVDGRLAGVPTTTGTNQLTVAALDALGCADVREYGLHVAACTFVLEPAGAVVPATGGSLTVVIRDGCGDTTATSPVDWLQVTATTATEVTLAVDANTGPGAGVRSAPLTIGRRTLLVQQAAPVSSAPFGVLDLPHDGSVASGSLAVGGWALDDLGVRRVALYRDPVAGETAWIYLGEAVFIPGARPDVAAAYPTLPDHDRGGWGFMILTNQLPNRGNGGVVLHAVAEDVEGHQTVLGSTRFTAANAGAIEPFGAIDTPAQGATVSGAAYLNFGWALTPQPNTIPVDGSTITVIVDGAPVGHVSYNHFRPDVSLAFPGLANSGGPVGYRALDTTALEEGLHSISWAVTDTAGVSSGIGSRYFRVSNSAGATPVDPALAVTAARPLERVEGPDLARRDASVASAPASDAATLDGPVAAEPLPALLRLATGSRVTFTLPPASPVCAGTWAGYLVDHGTLASLPVGASLDPTGRFYWEPGPAFRGRFRLRFVHTGCDGARQQRSITIRIN